MQTDLDVLIIGGGMIGASLAQALKDSSLRVGLVEAVPFEAAGQPSFDDRTTAFSAATARIFSGIGLWQEMQAQAWPISAVHVSQQGRFGTARIRAEEHQVPALGYVIENRHMGALFAQRLAAQDNLELFSPASFEALDIQGDHCRVTLNTASGTVQCGTRLLVAADGARSAVRAAAGITAEIDDYAQTAVVANIETSRANDGVGYERFTPTGPIAVLPAGERRCAAIWAVPPQDAETLCQLSDAAYLDALQHAFGWRLGKLQRVSRRLSFPLMRVTSSEVTAERTVVIGNAAHNLHPAAAQGFNLGMRDVAVLSELLNAAPEDAGSEALIRQYRQRRHADHQHVASFTDQLVRLFSNAIPGLGHARALGVLGVDLIPPVKARLARRGMGLVGDTPLLVRRSTSASG